MTQATPPRANLPEDGRTARRPEAKHPNQPSEAHQTAAESSPAQLVGGGATRGHSPAPARLWPAGLQEKQEK